MIAKEPELEGDNEVFIIFKRFDRDGSGSIDRAELAALLEALNQSPALGDDLGEEELDVAMISIDTNDSGRISWDEFQAWWSSR